MKDGLNRAAALLLIILILATLAFIWSRSLKSVAESSAESGRVVAAIKPVLEPVVGEGQVTDHLVRKLAHFSEFFVLGCELAALSLLMGRRGRGPVALCLLAGLCAAAIDETIQLFSARGSQLTDVLLDFSGVICGVAAALLAARIITSASRRGAGPASDGSGQ